MSHPSLTWINSKCIVQFPIVWKFSCYLSLIDFWLDFIVIRKHSIILIVEDEFIAQEKVHLDLWPYALNKRVYFGTSLVEEWIRTYQPFPGMWVQSPIWENFTCQRATNPVSHNHWAHPPCYWRPWAQLLNSTCLEPVLSNKRHNHDEKSTHQNRIALDHLN